MGLYVRLTNDYSYHLVKKIYKQLEKQQRRVEFGYLRNGRLRESPSLSAKAKLERPIRAGA